MDEDSARGDRRRRPSPRPQDSSGGRANGRMAGWAPILERHGRAALRFLQLCIGDEDDAAEIYRRFALELLHTEPGPGPCRDLLGEALVRLVNDRLPPAPPSSRPRAMPPPPPTAYGPSECDPQRAHFDALWREELMARARRRLKQLEERTGQPLHTALRRRGEAPGLSCQELAERIGHELGRRMSADDARQVLRSARAEFSRLLLEEVVATLPEGAPFGDVERELIDTGLLAFCREAFARFRPDPGRGR